ncbi:MAG: hypothetical protein ACI8Z5_000545 [Lentimonas sp.]|jgi:hypothetical protein
MREIRKSGSMRGSGRKALLRKRPLSLSTLPDKKIAEHKSLTLLFAANVRWLCLLAKASRYVFVLCFADVGCAD